MDLTPTLFIVDDDNAVSNALSGVANLMNLRAELFGSAEDFLATITPSRAGCLVLDYKLPGRSGLELQAELNRLGNMLPIIMISGHADVRAVVAAMKNGAINFLEKPVGLTLLCRAIESALELDAKRRQEFVVQEEALQQVAQLTKKEREVFDLVANGKTNKEIAKQLGLSIRAIEDRRARMMKKLKVEYLHEVIAIALKCPKPKTLQQRTTSISAPV